MVFTKRFVPFILVLLCAVCSVCMVVGSAQAIPPLMKYPHFKAFGSDGAPLYNGKLYTYSPGTLTLKSTYTDSGLTTPHPNPIVLGVDGEPATGNKSVYMDGAYKLMLYDADDVLVWSQDNYEEGSGGLSNDIKDIAEYGGDLCAAITAIGSTPTTLTIGHAITVSTNCTTPATLNLAVPRGGIISVSTGVTHTINSMPLASRYQIFSGAGTVLLGPGVSPIYPEWWGAVADGSGLTDDGPAIAKAIAAAGNGATISLTGAAGTYGYWISSAYPIVLDENASTQITIEGDGRSQIYSDVTGATITVQSSNGYRLRNFGIVATSANSSSAQHGIYVVNATGVEVTRVAVNGFYNGVTLTATTTMSAPQYNEVGLYDKVSVTNSTIGWNITSDKGKWTSFATNEWRQCIANISVDGGIGVKIGKYVDLYRSNMEINVHPTGSNSYGFYYEGMTDFMLGYWTVECHRAAHPTASNRTGIYFGDPGSMRTGLTGRIYTHVLACDTPYDRHTTGARPQGLLKGPGTQLVWPDYARPYASWTDASYYTTLRATTATAGDPTVFTISAATPVTNVVVGDHATVNAVNSTNPFYDALEDTMGVTVTAVDYALNTVTLDVDTSTSGTWEVGDNATLNMGAIRKQEWLTSDGTYQIKTKGKIQLQDLELEEGSAKAQLVSLIQYLTCQDADDNNTTPSVKGSACLNLANTGATTITDFLNPGVSGRLLFVTHGNSNTIIQHNANIVLENHADCQGYTGLTQVFRSQSGVWREITRSRNHTGIGSLATAPNYPSVGMMYMCNSGCASCYGDDGGNSTTPIWWDGTSWVCANGIPL